MTALSNLAPGAWRRRTVAPLVASRWHCSCRHRVAALTSERADWQPISARRRARRSSMVVADVAAVSARRIRISAGLMVQVTIMALLGPAPAVAIGLLVDRRRVARQPRATDVRAEQPRHVRAARPRRRRCCSSVLRASLGLDRHDTALRAARAARSTSLLVGVNLVLVVGCASALAHGDARARSSARPACRRCPLEFVNGADRRRHGARLGQRRPRGCRGAARRARDHDPARAHARRRAQERRRPDGAAAGVRRARSRGRAAGVRSRPAPVRGAARRGARARAPGGVAPRRPDAATVAMRQDMAEADATSVAASAGRGDRGDAGDHLRRSIPRPSASSASRRRCAPRSRRSRPRGRSRSRSAATSTTARSSDACCCPSRRSSSSTPSSTPTRRAIDVVGRRGRRNDRARGQRRRRRHRHAEAGRAVQAGHVGLAMVRRRVEDAGGQLEIATRSDGGTRSRVVVPIR